MKSLWTYCLGVLACCIGGNPALAVDTAEGLVGDPFVKRDNILNEEAIEEPGQNKNSFLQKGWLESRNQFWLRNEQAFSTRQRLWLEGGGILTFEDVASVTVAESMTARFFLSGFVDYDPTAADLSTDHDQLSAEIHEAYFTLDGTSADLTIGQKMVRWGKGDGVNPLDLINPQDHRDPFASARGDNRLAVPLIQVISSLPVPDHVQELAIEAVIVPLAKVTVLNAAGSAWEPFFLKNIRAREQTGMIFIDDQEKPECWFKEGKYGLHLSVTMNGWDLGGTVYSGVKNLPVFTGSPDADARVIFTPVHPRISAFGASFAKGVHRSTLRGELAIKPRYPIQKKDVFIPEYSRRTMFEGVVGFDRIFGFNRYLNLQYFFEYIPENNGVAGRRYSHGLTFECSGFFFNDDLKLGVNGVIGFSDQGWAIQPYSEYRIGDNWLLTLSCFLFHGDQNERFGQFADRDFISLRLRYSF